MIQYTHHIDSIKRLTFNEFKDAIFERYPHMNRGVLIQLFRKFSMNYPEIIHLNEKPAVISVANQSVYLTKCIQILDDFVKDMDVFMQSVLKDEYDPQVPKEFNKCNKGMRESMIDRKVIPENLSSDFSHRSSFAQNPNVNPTVPDPSMPNHFPSVVHHLPKARVSKFVRKNHPPPVFNKR